tara:strand:- start:14373 stop:16079 length:1707 start_codon:yes stop_codon:yes gene_type:complete
MISFEKIRFKNFLSVGDVFTEIQLDRSTTTLILGENGAGKSTMLDALCFVLFGKPFRKINKPQLVNSVNAKGALVEIDFKIGSNSYRVIRGLKPGIFEIYHNDTMLSQTAAAKDYQEHLEKNILKLNYNSFTQVVILGSSTFVPFMQLPAHARREVIEDLLDIKIFSVMNVLLKTRMQENKELLKDLDYELKLSTEKKEIQQKHIEELRDKNDEVRKGLEEELASIMFSIEELENKNIKYNEHRDDLEDKMEKTSIANKNIDELKRLEKKLNVKIKEHDKASNFYIENKNCPTCDQNITDEIRNKKIEESKFKISEISKGLLSLETQLFSALEVQKQYMSYLSEHQTTFTKIIGNTKEIDALKNYSNRISKKINDDTHIDLDSIIFEIQNLEKTLNTTRNKIEKEINTKELYSIASELLKDKGIKTQIVKQYIPIMNALINKYLAKMEFFVNFELDENFNEIIKSRHRDEFSYSSFSEGEKSRLDLALLLTWRSIAKMKNSSHTNLLILDEVFDGSLDTVGIDSLIDILTDMDNTNIFVISHKGEALQDKMRSIIRFEKYKNFSRIVT